MIIQGYDLVGDVHGHADRYYPDGDKDDVNAVFGYAGAETLFQVLSQCGDDLSRENVSILPNSGSLRRFFNPISNDY